jgi:hypothetical protein
MREVQLLDRLWDQMEKRITAAHYYQQQTLHHQL